MKLTLGRRGLTLIEIMLVIGMITILMSILLPNFMRAKGTASKKSCLSNLRVIDQSKQQFAMEHSKKDGDTVGWGDLVPHYMRTQPICPLGQSYALGLTGVAPTCPVEGHDLQSP